MAATRRALPAPATRGCLSGNAQSTLLLDEYKHKPDSIAALAKLTGRAPPNVTRTIGRLVAGGLVELKIVKRRKMAVAIVSYLRIDIDPFAQNDRVEFA